jgi:signal transduction histidine kinase
MQKKHSLTFRLIAAAAVWSVLALLVGGFVLSGAFRDSVQQSFDDRLTFDLEGLVAAAEADAPAHVTLENRFADPRFERIFSGWYWQIVPDGEVMASKQVQTSRSLWDQRIMPEHMASAGSSSWGNARGPEEQNLRVLSRRIVLPVTQADGKKTSRRFTFMVAGDLSSTEDQIARFNRTLIWSLAALGLGLVAAVVLQVRIGLQPLRRVGEALVRIREGRAKRLEGEFPPEIAPLAAELNGLIAHSAEVVGRARTHVANLAHFLKTPLTVLANEASAGEGPLAETVRRQVTVMRRQVDHYLARARAAGAVDVLGSRTELSPVLNDLARVLKRMHSAKELSIAVEVPTDLAFAGEREDLEEMAGNLIDNACKWAHSKILVRAAPQAPGRLVLSVSDDGPGLSEEERKRAVERGERIDESVPGTGLGLAIVRDIATLYGGNFTLGTGNAGGLEARLELPATRQ